MGPWSPASYVPIGIDLESWSIVTPDGRTVRTDVHGRVERAIGVFVIAPGLHFDGPADARFVRLGKVLADAGFVVVAPYLEDQMALCLRPRVADDLQAVVEATCDRFRELGRPVIFSISFGSFPAIVAAARLGDAVDGLITFGGYADFAEVALFCVDGAMRVDGELVHAPFDPTTRAALFVNLARHLLPDGTEADGAALEAAYLRFCRETWGTPDLHDVAFLTRVADGIRATLPPHLHEPFRLGVLPGHDVAELVAGALERGREDYERFDPRPHLAGLRCPLVLVHGREDDVIPWTEAVELSRKAPSRIPTRLYLTGLLSHTGHEPFRPLAVLREASTLVGIVRTLAGAGRIRRVIR